MSALERFVDGFHDYLARALSPLAARLAALESAPPPAKGDPGTSVTVEEVMPPLLAALDQAVKAIPPPAKGDPGTSVTVDEVRGLLEGEFAKWALQFERRAQDVLQRAIDRIPVPANGLDGLGFEDLTVERTGDRNFALVWSRDGQERRHELRFPAVIDRGVYAAGKRYEAGDGVTHLGSYWIAQMDAPPDLPGTVPDQWRLAVRKGRDGRHAEKARP